MSLGLNPIIEHEASVAVWHAWADGSPITGPSSRHTQCALASAFRAGISIKQGATGSVGDSFGDWRMAGRGLGESWQLDTSFPLGYLEDLAAPVSSFIPTGTPLVVVVRFLDKTTGEWRVLQFHDAELLESNATPSDETLMSGYSFQAGHMEPFHGKGTGMPGMEPRILGVAEWIHGGRRIPCHYYDELTDTWTESAENIFPAGGETSRYIDISESAGSWSLDYLAAVTGTEAAGAGGIDSTRVGWLLVRAMEVSPSSGLTLEPGWETELGSAEPLQLPPSGQHWEAPQLQLRVLGRIYATFRSGVLSLPSYTEGDPETPPLDPLIRIGRMIFLPYGARLLDA